LDANLVRVAPSAMLQAGLAYLYHDAFGLNAYFQKR
jgi:hypothetical protein